MFASSKGLSAGGWSVSVVCGVGLDVEPATLEEPEELVDDEPDFSFGFLGGFNLGSGCLGSGCFGRVL